KIGTNCIERGVCQVSSQETRTFSPIESIYDMSGGPLDDRRSLLMAFAIKNLDISSKKNLCFGMAVVDTSSSKLTLSQFVDDSYFSRLRTFLSIYNVKKIIVESSSLNPALKSLFKSFQCIIETLRRSSEFPSSPQDAVQKFLASSKLKPTDIPGPLAHRFEYLSESSYKVKVDSELAITSLGALSWYLGYHKIDEEIFAMKNFHDYLPIDSGASDNIASSQTHMVMDSAVIQSLSLISSEDTKPAGNAKRSKSNSLLDVIDFTQSFKGKDIIKKWLIYPLYKYEDIVRRQEIIRHLIKCEIIDRVDFKMLPNYTRLLSVANSLAAKSHDHPEYQAVLFCLSTINKRKANILLLLLNGFMDLSKKFEKLKSVIMR
ncbi:MAG: DNA mismatch repair protein msh6, partial [Marteilia pararefringens]